MAQRKDKKKDKKIDTLTPEQLQALYDFTLEVKEAKKVVAMSPLELQKIIDRSREISQEMIEEYRRISEQIRLLKLDLASVVNEMTELLAIGAPVCKGRRNVQLVNGYLAISLIEPPK